jgi:hypothetical protein
VVPGTFGTALDEVNGGSCGRVGTFLLCANFSELRYDEVQQSPPRQLRSASEEARTAGGPVKGERRKERTAPTL